MTKIKSNLIMGITLVLVSLSSTAAQVEVSKVQVPESVKCLKIQLDKSISLEKAYQACSVKK